MSDTNTGLWTFTDTDFEEQVLRSDRPVLVDFHASWCGPCQVLAPTISDLAAEFEGVARVGKLDVDENTATAASHAIQSIPTVLVFHRGEVVQTLVGVKDHETYARVLRDLVVSRAGSLPGA